jgi:hypothetical protein
MNGKVLIAGGSDNSGKTTNTALLYDPSTGTYSSTGNMNSSRDFHTATLLPGGKVLIAGGRTSSGSGYTYLATGEVYDPNTGLFTTVVGTTMSSSRYSHTAVLFNGKVLIAGGDSTAVATADLFDPSTGTFVATGSPATARQYAAAALFGGMVVEAGGYNGSSQPPQLKSAEQYQCSNLNCAFGSAGNMTAPRAGHTATTTQLNNGSVIVVIVLVTGGQGVGGTSVATAEILK